MNEDWSAYLKMCSEKCLKPQENHEDHVSSLSSILKILLTQHSPALRALRDKLEIDIEEPMTDENLIRLAHPFLRAEKSM